MQFQCQSAALLADRHLSRHARTQHDARVAGGNPFAERVRRVLHDVEQRLDQLFAIAADPAVWWWTAVGPLTIIVLFLGASIPTMDERSAARRPGWAEYAARTPAIWPRRPGSHEHRLP